MGVDCSMILRDDSVRKSRPEKERVGRLHQMEELLIKKYGVAKREDAIEFEDLEDERGPRFNFEPYCIISINIYVGFWEIETSWGYGLYFKDDGGPSDYQKDFFEIAQDFGCEDAYICSEYYAWNSDYLYDHTFEEWILEVESRLGEIREIESDTMFDIDESKCPGVFHESFSNLNAERTELSRKLSPLGFSLYDSCISRQRFIRVSRDERVYLLDRESLELLLPDPITDYINLNGQSFEAVSGGKTYLFASDGQLLHIADCGLFVWEYASGLENFSEYHSIRVFNPKTGQEVFIVNSMRPSAEPNYYYAYRSYYDRSRNPIIPELRL